MSARAMFTKLGRTHSVCKLCETKMKDIDELITNQINYYFEDILTKCGEGLWPSKSRQ